MFDLDKWREVWHTLRRNKLRTLMTAAGVFWGIFMLILMLGFGKGLERGVRKNMLGFVTNAVHVWPQHTKIAYKGFQSGRRIQFTNRDIDLLRREVSGIEYLAPRLQLGGWKDGSNVTYAHKTGNFGVMGDVDELQYVEQLSVDRGRFINQLDNAQIRKVAVIGPQTYQVLFDSQGDPIGKYIKIHGVFFQVVGIFRSDLPGEQGDRLASTIYVPFATFQEAFHQRDHVGWFSMTARSATDAPAVESAVRQVLSKAHAVHPDDDEAVGSFNTAQEFGRVMSLFTGLRFFVWLVGTLTLLAGALGVSNIMLIVVKERTREFGIRKALGATPASLISLVVQEAATLTTLAGYAGIVVAVAFLELSARFVSGSNKVLGSPEVDFQVTLLATGVLIVTGIIAGIVPARHAARINPVEALRSE